jgi:hypothetical protein
LEKENEKEKEAILVKLQLLANMRRQHEWITFGQKEANKEEEAEAKIDTEASDSAPDKPEAK